MYDIAVIMINYNTAQYTLQSIAKVVEHTSTINSYEIIVIDNCSKTSDYNLLKTSIPKDSHIQLHRSDLNTGFGGGNALGASFANAQYLLFLNNDAFLQNDCLFLIKDFMQSNADVGVATAQNYDENGSFVPSFDHNKGIRRLLFGRGFLETTQPSRYPKRKQEYQDPLTVDWVNGAFLFFRKEAYHKIGGFDINIFLFWEEMDISERLRRKGYKTVLFPNAKITHVQGASTGASKEIITEGYISYLYVIKKHSNTLRYQLIKNYLSFIFLFKSKKRYLRSTINNERRLEESLRHK